MFPRPTEQYDRRTAEHHNTQLERELSDRRTRNEVLILRSPDGTPWEIQVDDAGVISAALAV